MGNFNNLFGDDRDIVQETGATAGQKLRVNSTDPTKLESFDLAVETMAGAATPTTVNLSGVGNADAVNGLGGNTLPGPNLAGSFAAANVVGFQFQNNLGSDLTGFTDGQTFTSLTVTLDSTGTIAPRNIAVTWNATWMYISGNNSDNNNSFPVIVALEDGSTFTDASSTYNWDNSYPGNQLSESNGSLSLGGAAGADVTTVTGDLKVTGLEAGNVVSDADGNLSIGSGGGVSGTASFFPIFDSSDDGVGDSAMSQQDRSNHAGVTTVRIGGIGGQLYSGFGRLTNSFDGATLIIPVTANSFPDQGTAFFAVPGGSGFHGPLQYTTWRNGSGDGIFKGDETFSTNTGAYTGDFISFQVGDSFAQLTTLRAELTAAADTTTLTLGGSGNINLGFEVAVSSDFVVQTHGDINVDTTLTMSGDLEVAGAAQLSGNTSVGGTLTVTGNTNLCVALDDAADTADGCYTLRMANSGDAGTAGTITFVRE